MKEMCARIKKEQADMEAYLDAYFVCEIRLENEIDQQERMVLKDNNGGVNNEKAIIYDNMLGVYMKGKNLIQCWYSMEMPGYDGKKGIW